MTLTVVNGYQTTPAGSGTDGDTLLVTGTGIIAYDGDAAIFMSGDNQTTTIFGEVYSSTGRAILSQGLNAKVYVAEGANVSGATGTIQTGDNGYIQNAGTLQISAGYSVYMPSGTLQNVGTILGSVSIRGAGSIVNYGDMLSYTQIDSSDPAQNFSVYNSGHMQTFDSRDFNTNFENHGLVDSFYCQNFLTLTNTGTISSLRFDNGGGSIINHGLIGGQAIFFSSGNDFYNGRDRVIEGAIYAGDGNDTIYTGAANDTIYGEGGNDTLDGGIGADTMDGGTGNDNLTGGTGNDSFLFNTALSATTNVDHIFNFSSVDDKILLSHSVFTAAGGLGTLAAGAFHIGAGAADADDRIIYDSSAGALIYDSNGNAAGGATPFATLATGLALTHSNFTIV